jgi:small conductance mechanosensitive channel
MNVDIEKLLPLVYEKGVNLGAKIIGVVVLWVIGRFVIGWVKRLVGSSLRARSTEATVISYAESVVSVLLTILLVAALLGVLGVETTSLAGLLAAAGLAIGTAWGGLLANFAAGAFMTILRPFKKGDFVTIAGGVTGTVEEIGVFVTTIHTMDNVAIMVGNNKVFGDVIQNFTHNPFRRVDRSAQLAHNADHQRAIVVLKEALAKIPNVLPSPAPDVEILDFTLAGPVLAVRPYCHNDHYWQVYFDTNRAIREELGKAGFSVPEQHIHMDAKMLLAPLRL